MQVSYDAVSGLDELYVDLLRSHELAVRRVLANQGCMESVQWLAVADHNGNQAFELVATDGNRLARVTPLELALLSADFEDRLLDGREAREWIRS